MTLRVLCIAALLLASREIAAARVVMRPSIARSCPGTKSWETTRSCVARFGKVTEVRARHDMHLVRVAPKDGVWGVGGLYLYTLKARQWGLTGMILGDGQRDLTIKQLTIHEQTVWRIDYDLVATDDISTDGVSSRTARFRSKHVVFCTGEYASCAEVMTSCDVFVSGKTLWSFHGTLQVGKAGELHITGDRSQAGDRCQQEENSYIPISGNEPTVID